MPPLEPAQGGGSSAAKGGVTRELKMNNREVRELQREVNSEAKGEVEMNANEVNGLLSTGNNEGMGEGKSEGK